MNPSLRDRIVGGRFDALAGRFKADVDDDDYRLGAVVRALDGLECPLVLDLGCGKGRFARQLGRRGARVVGLDLSTAMLAAATGIDRVRGSSARLPFGVGAFDAAVAIEVLEHLGDLGPTLDELRRVVRPGGRVVLVDKNARSLDPTRPWLPALVVKRIDELRGRWMYGPADPVRERWFDPLGLARRLGTTFDDVRVDHLLSPMEEPRAIFRRVPAVRRMACWRASVPGGDA